MSEEPEVRKFAREGNKRYSLKEKQELGELIKKYKTEYDDYIKQNQTRINYKVSFSKMKSEIGFKYWLNENIEY